MKVIVLMLISLSLSAQDIKEMVKNVKVDIQYSKKYNYYIVSPFANNNEQDCSLLEVKFNSDFEKIKDGIWLSKNYTVQRCSSQLGNYYLFIKKEN